MIKMPYDEIIARIKEEKKLSDEEIQEKIRQKMDILSGLISKEGAAYIIANELGIKLIQTSGTLQIKKILIGMRSVETAGVVMRKFPINEFDKNGRAGKVASFILADETGQIRVTAWNENTSMLSKFNEGDTIKIAGAYVRENNANKELHLNNMCKIIINPEGINIKVSPGVFSAQGTGAEFQRAARKKISELADSDDNIEILGHVVQVFDPKFFPVCPICNRKVEQIDSGFKCAEHSIVQPEYSYVINAYIDDGSDNIRVVFFRKQALNLFKLKEEEMAVFRNAPELFEKLKTDILGEMVKIIGRVNRNDMFDRLEMISRLVFRDINPDDEIKKMGETQQTQKAEPKKDSPKIPQPQLQEKPHVTKIPVKKPDTEGVVEEQILSTDIDDYDDDDYPPKKRNLPSIDDI